VADAGCAADAAGALTAADAGAAAPFETAELTNTITPSPAATTRLLKRISCCVRAA
jgi:hypothetical protein